MLVDDPGLPAGDPPGRPETAGYAELPRWCRVVARAGGIVVPTVVVPVSLLGALVTPAWAVLGLGPLLGAVAAAAVPGTEVSPAARRTALWLVGTGVLAVPFAAGAGMLGGVGLVLVLVLVVLAPFLTAERLIGSAAGPDDLARLGTIVPSLSTAQLLDAWAVTEDELRRRPAARQRAGTVRLRTVLLDELTRRDPAGVEQWLRAGDSSPQQYIRVDSPR